ncbi:MAG: efflux RND transporter periplasmic adaptor subunit [Candidatus Sumerlaeia bacterium]
MSQGGTEYAIRKAQVQPRDIRSYITELGTVFYLRSWKVYALTGGELKKNYIREEDHVEKDQLLVELESETLQDELEQLEEDLEQARSDYEYQKDHEFPLQLEEQENALEKTRLDIANAREDLEDARGRLERGLIPPRELERIERKIESQEASYKLSEKKYKNLKENEIPRRLEKQEEAISDLEEKLDHVKEDIAELKIYAPATGLVHRLSPDLPDKYTKANMIRIGQGSQVALIVDEKGRRIEVRLYEQDLEKIKIGDPVEITTDQKPDLKLEGEILRIGEATSSFAGQSRRFTVEIILEEGSEQLRVNSSVRCRILASTRRDVPAIPVEYVLYRDGRRFCKVVQDNDVVDVPIRLGSSDEEYVEVLEGLEPGQEVVRYVPKPGNP